MSEREENNITVTALFFGAARDAAGVAQATVKVDGDSKVSSVKETVFADYEAVSLLAKSLMVAVNEEYAADDTAVRDQDVIAFLPPVSGG